MMMPRNTSKPMIKPRNSKLKRAFHALLTMVIVIPVIVIIEPTRKEIIGAYNNIRPKLLSGGGSTCVERLKKQGVELSIRADFFDGLCGIHNPVLVHGFSSTKLNSPALLSCPSASAFNELLTEIDAKSVTHIGTYNCRQQRRSRVMSEHSFGTAIDITKIDGASVSRDWNQPNEKGKILQSAYKAACKHFTNVITPDDDALHHDHFHLDNGPGFGCKLKPLIKSVNNLLTLSF